MLWSFKSGKCKSEGFGVLIYLAGISIVSNLFFPIGTNMAERFLFMPSAGFCLAAASLWTRFAPTLYMRGNAYLMLQQYEQAAKDYRYALHLNPAYSTVSNNLTLCLREAAKALSQAYSLSGNTAQAQQIDKKIKALPPSQ